MGKVSEIYGTTEEIAYADTDSAIAPAAIEPNTPTTSGKTQNYGLPQWAGSDITDWFELNPAFEKIDEVMHANAEAVETSQSTGDSNTTAISNLTQSLNNTISRVTDVENVNTQQGQQITLNVTHLNEHDTAIQALQTAQAAMNETLEDVTGEAATSTADITDLKQRVQVAEGNISTNADNIGNMQQLQTSDKSNLVAAINAIQTAIPQKSNDSIAIVSIAGATPPLSVSKVGFARYDLLSGGVGATINHIEWGVRVQAIPDTQINEIKAAIQQVLNKKGAGATVYVTILVTANLKYALDTAQVKQVVTRTSTGTTTSTYENITGLETTYRDYIPVPLFNTERPQIADVNITLLGPIMYIIH